MYFVANWKMFGDIKSLKSLDKVIKFSKSKEINKTNISTQEFIDYLNGSNIPQKTIRENLENNIIEELLSSLVSTTLLDLEIDDNNLSISEITLLKKIKQNKNFLDEEGNFQRTKYEKFLLENNQSAPQFEQRLIKRELQKNLFDYIGAGTVSPSFLIKRLYEEENTKLEIDFISLENFYKKKNEFSNEDLENFLEENKEQLKIEYLDFNYAVINPLNLIGINEFNQSFFDKVDQIEIDIANGVQFKTIISKFNIPLVQKNNFQISSESNDIEKKIFEFRNIDYDIFENGDDYIVYKIHKIDTRKPDLSNNRTKNEVAEIVFQKNRFDYNQQLIKKIRDNKFNNSDFLKMSQNKIQTIKLNSIKDNKKFNIDAVEILYSLPVDSFSLINDDKNNVFLAKNKNFKTKTLEKNSEKLKEYLNKQNSNIKNSILKSYDQYLNNKYDVILNQKTIERVKNFFR